MTKETPPFLEKIGLKYYTPSLIIILTIMIYEYTGNIQLAVALKVWLAHIGYYLPKQSDEGAKYSKYHNSHIYHIFPLLTDCAVSVFFIIWSFYKYEQICINTANTLGFIFIYLFSIPKNIDACHQLFHRNENILKVISFITLSIHQFTTYPIQHVYLHHKKVGTKEDPITSPKNMTYYQYVFRAIFYSYKANYHYSKTILFLCVLVNWCYLGLLGLLALYQGLSYQSGLNKVLFFMMMSYIGVAMMEVIEYVEHYGLVCRNSGDDKVTQQCSWNSDYNSFLNWQVFKFQSHSDHHMNAYKVYSSMELTSTMPKLPFDFMVGILLALIPPLWFKTVNPFVDEILQGKKVEDKNVKFAAIVRNIVVFLVLAHSGYTAVYSLIE